MTLFANDPIMLGTLILSFRHLEHQNLSIFSEDKCGARMVQQFQRITGLEESDQIRGVQLLLGDVIFKWSMVV